MKLHVFLPGLALLALSKKVLGLTPGPEAFLVEFAYSLLLVY